MLDRLRRPIRRWPLRIVSGLAVAVAIVFAAAGAASQSGDIDRLTSERDALVEEVDRWKGDYDAAVADFDSVSDDLDTSEVRLRRARARLAAIGDLEARKRELARDVADLSGRVRDEQAKLSTVKVEVAKSSFGEGTWQMNVDFIPGTYKAEGGELCYWAKLSSPSGDGIDNIIDNGGFHANQIVSVDSPYFETSGCGTWQKVG